MGNSTQNTTAVVGNGMYEPLNIGYFVDKTWGLAWPNVIGRAWHYQHQNPINAQKVENGEYIEFPNGNDRWYMDLMSKDPYKTLKALEAEGFIFLANSDAAEEDWQHWFFTKIIVRTRTQALTFDVTATSSEESNTGYAYGSSSSTASGYCRTNPWQNDITGTGHFLVLTLPPKPPEVENFSVALSDFKTSNKVYPFS